MVSLLGLRRRQPWQAGSSWEYAPVSTITPHSSSPVAWRFTSKQPMSSGATCSAGRTRKAFCNGLPTRPAQHSPMAATASRLDASTSGPRAAMHSTGFTLATVLIFGSGLFVLATLFFGTKGGYYDSDDYDGNGTAH